MHGTWEIRGRHDRKRRKYSTMTVQNFSIVGFDFISRHYQDAMAPTGSQRPGRSIRICRTCLVGPEEKERGERERET